MSKDSATSNVGADRDLLDERRAVGIVNALTDHDTTTCSDCGEEIDVADATDPMAVVTTLEQHRQSCQGRWYDE